MLPKAVRDWARGEHARLRLPDEWHSDPALKRRYVAAANAALGLKTGSGIIKKSVESVEAKGSVKESSESSDDSDTKALSKPRFSEPRLSEPLSEPLAEFVRRIRPATEEDRAPLLGALAAATSPTNTTVVMEGVDWARLTDECNVFTRRLGAGDAARIVVRQSQRMTRVLGKTCCKKGVEGPYEIRMGNTTQFGPAFGTLEHRLHTLLHEIAHVLANSHALTLPATCHCVAATGKHRGHGHDGLWEAFCLKLGIRASRLHPTTL